MEHYLRPGTLQLGLLPPLALYVHLPWCLRKCPYCDFNSHEVGVSPAQPRPAVGVSGRVKTESMSQPVSPPGSQPGSQPVSQPVLSLPARGHPGPQVDTRHGLDPQLERRYLDALCADLEQSLPWVWGRRVHSIFIGGGTPSLFSPASIDRLLADIRARLVLEAGCEVTLEANPGTFERERFRAFRAAGVTRLSIGVQSFDDAALARIGRVHDAAQARAAVEEAASAFDTFNLDLMYALPDQDLAALDRDLDTALSFAPPHLSIYHLTLEPNTAFAHRPPTLPDDDTASAMLDRIVERTAEAGLQRYEVSAFARRAHHCRHNLNYWQFGDYLGIGAGAHGKLSFPHRVVRQVKWREPARYMAQALDGKALSNEHEVARDALPFEYMLNALRLREGFALQDFRDRTGLPLSVIEPALAQAQQRGLLDVDLTHARPTARGFDFLSDLQQLFL